MDKDKIEHVYVSVRPYVSNAAMIRDFLDDNSSLEVKALSIKADEMAHTKTGTEKTDFIILFNELTKKMDK